MTKLKSAKEKLNELIDIMPFELSESIKPYILEYGKILQQNAIEAALEVAAEIVVDRYETRTGEAIDKLSITSLINHKNLKL